MQNAKMQTSPKPCSSRWPSSATRSTSRTRRTAKSASAEKKEMYKTKNIRLLSELPDPFTKSDLVKLRRKYGMEGECAYIITRWMKAGFVDYEGKQYKKIATPNDKTKNP